jgi:hypothetical protein
MPDTLPVGFYQVLLLPAVLYIGAAIYGPTTAISRKKIPPGQKRKY